MAGSVNKVILVGNLGKDPEIRRTQDGRPIANLSIATSETWRDKGTGERKEKTEWHRVVIFNEGLCKVAEQYLKKGAKVYIEGALQTRKWTDQSGVEKYSTEVVLQGFNSTLTMLDGRSGGGGGSFGSDDAGGDFGSGGPVSSRAARARLPAPAPATATWTTTSRSERSRAPQTSRRSGWEIPLAGWQRLLQASLVRGAEGTCRSGIGDRARARQDHGSAIGVCGALDLRRIVSRWCPGRDARGLVRALGRRRCEQRCRRHPFRSAKRPSRRVCQRRRRRSPVSP